MLLTVAISALAACGVVLMFGLLLDCLLYPVPRRNTIMIVRLEGDTGCVEHTIRACLRLRQRKGYGERIVFVDGGIDMEAQLAAELLLRHQPGAALCAQSQIPDFIRWEKETVGAGTN